MAYFDNNATTPLLPEVREAVVSWLDWHGNPSSAHRAGREARRAVEESRDEVATLLGAGRDDVVFTASGTEANLTVLAAVGEAARAGNRVGDRVVVSGLEHPSVAAGARRLADRGLEVVLVAPAADGVVPAAEVMAAVDDTTRLVCLLRASNVLGTLQPVAEVAAACRARGVPLLTDAVQAVGKVPVGVGELGADYVVLGGHKMHAPLGAAALWIRPGAPFRPLLVGGGQEGGRRAGTENVAAIVGLGVAARLAREDLGERMRRLAALRDRFEREAAALGDVRVHGAGAPRLPNTSHLAFLGLAGADLAARLDAAGHAVSTGAACHDGRPAASPALLAMGIGEAEALASLRVSFSVANTDAELDALLAVLAREVPALRAAPCTRAGRTR